jgi:hypothetical protein
MSLRRALEALPDDRETKSATRSVVAFFEEHPNEAVGCDRISRATGLARSRVESIVHALIDGYVIDCGGSRESACTFVPTPVLELEVRRYLRSSATPHSTLQRGTERFRSRYGGVL